MIGPKVFIHAIPAYFFAYAGIRTLFGHQVALNTTLFLATCVLVAGFVAPKIFDNQ